MRKVINNRTLLLVIGLIVGLATLLSHSVRLEISKPKTEQSKESGEQKVVITPSDAVTVHAFVFQVDSAMEVSAVYQSAEKITKAVPVIQKTVSTYFRALFRFIIAPNAP